MRDDCLNPGLNKRAKHFLRKRKIAESFHLEGYDDLAGKLSDCQETSRQCICVHCAHVFYVQDRCRQRVCPLCSWWESRKRGDFIERMCHAMKFPKFITLTIPRWKKVPGDGITYLRDRWNELRGTKLFANVRGGMYQIELKPKEDGWHIHLHAILDAPFIPYQQLFSAWTMLIGAPYLRVDVRACTTPAQMHYAAKYAAKAADYEGASSTVVAWYEATHGKRLYGTYGAWYHAEPPPEPVNPNPIEKDFVCPRCGKSGTCCTREGLAWMTDKDTRRHFIRELDNAGPPTLSVW